MVSDRACSRQPRRLGPWDAWDLGTLGTLGTLGAYRWLNRPKAPFSLIVKGAAGDWQFAPSGNGTRVTWTYAFDLTSPLAYPAGALLLRLFHKWMEQNLGNLRQQLNDS